MTTTETTQETPSQESLFEDRPPGWTPDLEAEVDRLEALLQGIRKHPVGGRSKKAREQRDRNYRREQDLRSKIRAKCPRPPFKVADNGVHEYQETEDYVLFRNHGESYWFGLLLPRGQAGHQTVHLEEKRGEAGDVVGWVCGHRDPEVVRAAIIRELAAD